MKEGWDSMTIDVHSAWPERRGHIVGTNPKDWNTYSAARTTGTEASFVTLIELQEEKADRQVRSVHADGPDRITVKLADGRTHHWRVEGLDADEDRPSSVSLQMVEKNAEGEPLRRERTQ